jgi:hypothetical protein
VAEQHALGKPVERERITKEHMSFDPREVLMGIPIA